MMIALTSAIETLNPTAVQSNIEAGININALLPCQQYPLAHAIDVFFNSVPADEKHFEEVVSLLVNAGANTTIRFPDIGNDQQKNISLLQKICSYKGPADSRYAIETFMSDFIFVEHFPCLRKSPQAHEDCLIRIADLMLRQPTHPDLDTIPEHDAPIFLAMRHGLFKVVAFLIARGANIHVRDEEGNTLLHYACAAGHKELVTDLIKKGLDLHQANQHGAKPIAACRKHLHLSLMLLKHPGTSMYSNHIELLALAEKEQDLPLIDFLFENGVAAMKTKTDANALHYIKTVPLAERLVAARADINAVWHGRTPLFIACQHYNTALSVFFIQHGAKIDFLDPQNQTVLHFLAHDLTLTPEFYETLTITSIDIDKQNDQGDTALHIACGSFNLNFVLFLMKNKCNMRLENKEGKLALETFVTHHRSQEGSPTEQGAKLKEIFSQLLRSFPVGRIPKNNNDLICFLHFYGLHELTVSLLNLIPIQQLTQQEITDLIKSAVYTGNFLALEWLVSAGTSLCIPKIFLSPINRLDKKMVEFLLQHGARSESTSSYDNVFFYLFRHCATLLKAEQHRTAIEIFHLFIPHMDLDLSSAACISSLVNNAIDSMYSESKIQQNETLWYFVKHFTAKKLPLYKDQRVLMQAAMIHADMKLLLRLITENDPTENHRNKIALFETAVQNNNANLLDFLIQQAPEIPQCTLSDEWPGYDTTPLERIFVQVPQCRFVSDVENLESMAITLIKSGTPTHFLSSAFHRAITLNFLRVTALLLEKNQGYTVDMPIVSFGASAKNAFPLELAVECGHVQMAMLLIEHGADPNKTFDPADSLLHLACRQGNPEMARCLINAGAALNHKRTLTSFWGPVEFTPLAEGLEPTHAPKTINALIALFLAHNVTVDRIILLKIISLPCIEAQHLDQIIVKLRFDEIASTWALHLTVSKKNILLTQLLIKHYQKELVNMRDLYGRTPLHIATRQTEPELKIIFDMLLHAGADPNSLDCYGLSIKEYAMFYETSTPLQIDHPMNFPHHAFQKLSTFFSNQPEFLTRETQDQTQRKFDLGLCSYKLIRLFGDFESAKQYVEKHAAKDAMQPIHDLCLFNLPQNADWDPSAWAALASQHGNMLTKYLSLAPSIETILGNRSPTNIEEIIRASADLKYNRGSENAELAALFSKHQVSEIVFNRILDLKHRKTSDHLPPLCIDGSELKISSTNKKVTRYRFVKLQCDDNRGFILGELTECCQSVGKQGESCAMHGMTSTYGGFYVLLKKTDLKDHDRLEKLIGLIESSENYDAFLSKIPIKEQRKKYKKWQEDRSSAQPDTSDASLLSHLKQELQSEREANGSEQIVAQTWAWLSHTGKLVFDSWERRHIQDDEFCAPFLQAAAIQAIEKYGISEVLLGAGGNTPHHLEFKEAETSETPKDYFNYRDSGKQLVVFSQSSLPNLMREQKENQLPEPSKIEIHSTDFLPSYLHVGQNLERILSLWAKKISHPQIFILPTEALEVKKTTKYGYTFASDDAENRSIYSDFGTDAKTAAEKLTTVIKKDNILKKIMQAGTRDLLHSEAFLQYLINSEVLDSTERSSVVEKPEAYIKRTAVMSAFITYHVKQDDSGIALHPAILHALAHLAKTRLYLWEAAADRQLLPYRQEVSYDYSSFTLTEETVYPPYHLLWTGESWRTIYFQGLPSNRPQHPMYPYDMPAPEFSIRTPLDPTANYILPIKKLLAGKEQGWAALIFKPHTEKPIWESNASHALIYLDASGSRPPEPLLNYLHKTVNHQIRKSNVAYHTHASDSLAWLLTALKLFILTGKLNTPPIENPQQLFEVYAQLSRSPEHSQRPSQQAQEEKSLPLNDYRFFKPIEARRPNPSPIRALREIDVPANKNCLFYAVALSYLLPVLENTAEFTIHFHKLFGTEAVADNAAIELQQILHCYDGNASFIIEHANTFEILVDIRFRATVVSYIEQHTNEFSTPAYTPIEEKDFQHAMPRMKTPQNWGNHRELAAICRLLERNIIVYSTNEDTYEECARYENANSALDPIYLVHLNTQTEKGTPNYYHYLISPEYLQNSISNSLVPA